MPGETAQQPMPAGNGQQQRTRPARKAGAKTGRAKATRGAGSRPATLPVPDAPHTARIQRQESARGAAAIHPLAKGLADTLLTAGPSWTPEQAKAFEAAVAGAMPVICAKVA
jgi:hypothetical protein